MQETLSKGETEVMQEFDSKSSYKQSIKATSIFGGVQIILILVAIIKSKFIAVLLGTTGVGIIGLLSSSTSLINSITSFGLGTSAVKNVSAAFVSGDATRLGRTVSTVKRLVWITGLLGFLMTFILAPYLSRLAFGDGSYTNAFMLISAAALIGQLSSGKEIILRATRKVEFLSKATVIGAVIGLISSISLYYLFGAQGIVPAIILTAGTAFTLNWIYCSKVQLPAYKINRSDVLTEGLDMMRMGSLISITNLLTLAAAYIVQLFISHNGGVDQVGLYTAGFAIINTYVGMIFTAMGIDYFPRLAGVMGKTQERNIVVNQQIEIAILLLTPVITVFIVFINILVVLLYSNQFTPVNEMILWAALGMFFKASSWSIAFMFLAKGDARMFFWNELIANIYLLTFNIIGYKLLGLTGLGISFLVTYIVYAAQVYAITKMKYEFAFSQNGIRNFTFQLMLAILCFIFVKFLPAPYCYLVGSLIIATSVWYTFHELDKRLELKSYITKLIKRTR